MLWNDLLTPLAHRLAAFGGALVAGCAALPPSPGSLAVARRDAIDDFSLEARFSRHEDQNYSGRLSWRHSGGDVDELLLASPFGQGIAQLISDPRGARLTLSDGQVYTAEDGAALTRQVLGYPLPVAQLADCAGAAPRSRPISAGARCACAKTAGTSLTTTTATTRKRRPAGSSRAARRRAPNCGCASTSGLLCRLRCRPPRTLYEFHRQLVGLAQRLSGAGWVLNLFLHVVGRRADGYHLLQTLFRLVDYGDSLRFSPRADGEIRPATPLPGVAPESDLTVRAARLCKPRPAAARALKLPSTSACRWAAASAAAALDAANVLLALNHSWQLGVPRARLQQIGLTLGADVPVFVGGRNAFAEGVGEALLPDLPPAWYVVLEPPAAVPTAAIFGAPELKRDTLPMTAADWAPGVGGNDLQAVAVVRFPAVAEHLRWLAGYGDARMSGIGRLLLPSSARRRRAVLDDPGDDGRLDRRRAGASSAVGARRVAAVAGHERESYCC